MRSSILILALCSLSSCTSLDREDEQMLRGDFTQVSAVALVRVQSVQNTQTIGDYHENRVETLILEPFKGDLKTGQRLDFYEVVEGSGQIEGEKIVFLNQVRSHGQGPLVFVALENSTKPGRMAFLKQLRELRQEGR